MNFLMIQVMYSTLNINSVLQIASVFTLASFIINDNEKYGLFLLVLYLY